MAHKHVSFHLKYTGLSNTLTVRWPDIAALCKDISTLFDLEFLSFCLHAPDFPRLYSFSTVEGILFAVDFTWRPRSYFPRILIARAVAWDCLVHLTGEKNQTLQLNCPGWYVCRNASAKPTKRHTKKYPGLHSSCQGCCNGFKFIYSLLTCQGIFKYIMNSSMHAASSEAG